MTNEELQQQLNQELKEVITKTTQAIKNYVDTHTLSADANEKLQKAYNLSNSLLNLFDTSGDGAISLDEFTAKLDEIYAHLNSVTALQNQVVSIAGDLGAVKEKIASFSTRDDLKTILTIDEDGILSAVNGILSPESSADENNSDTSDNTNTNADNSDDTSDVNSNSNNGDGATL